MKELKAKKAAAAQSELDGQKADLKQARAHIKALERLLKRELGLEIDPQRLRPVCCQSLAWGMREVRPPSHPPSHGSDEAAGAL